MKPCHLGINRRAMFFAAATSGLIHIAAALLWTIASYHGLWTPHPIRIAPNHQPYVELLGIMTDASSGAPAITIDKDALWQRLRQYTTRPAPTPEALQQAQTLDTLGKRADTSVHKESIAEIARYLDLPGNAYTPSSKPGPIDFTTLAYQDIRAATDDTGTQGVHITWVDREGHTIEGDLFGKEAEPYLHLVSVFETIRAHPNLAAIYHTIVKPLSGEILHEQQTGKTSLPSTEPNTSPPSP